jgi:prevent-host-death family protein
MVSKVSVKEARENLRALLDRVVQGDEVVILRRGKEVARLVPPRRDLRRLPSLEAFRNSIRYKGKPLSTDVVRGRREERY